MANTLIPLIILGALLFLMFSRTRRQQREVHQVQSSLEPGMQVMTSAGLYATVLAVEDDIITLEMAPGQSSRWDRRAIVRVLPGSTDLAAPEQGEVGAARPEYGDNEHGDNEHGDHQDNEEKGGAHGVAPPPQDTAPPDRA